MPVFFPDPLFKKSYSPAPFQAAAPAQLRSLRKGRKNKPVLEVAPRASNQNEGGGLLATAVAEMRVG